MWEGCLVLLVSLQRLEKGKVSNERVLALIFVGVICHGSVWLTVRYAGYCLLPCSPAWWAGEKEFFVFLLDCKGWWMLRKRGWGVYVCVCAWEEWRKITQFLYSSFGSLLMEAKRGYWLLCICFRFCKLFLENWSSSLQLCWAAAWQNLLNSQSSNAEQNQYMSICLQLEKALSERVTWAICLHTYQPKIASVYIGLQTGLHVCVHFF